MTAERLCGDQRICRVAQSGPGQGGRVTPIIVLSREQRKRGLILWRRRHSLQPHKCDKDTARQVTAPVDQEPSEHLQVTGGLSGTIAAGGSVQGMEGINAGSAPSLPLAPLSWPAQPGPRRLTKEDCPDLSRYGEANPAPCQGVKRSHDKTSSALRTGAEDGRVPREAAFSYNPQVIPPGTTRK